MDLNIECSTPTKFDSEDSFACAGGGDEEAPPVGRGRESGRVQELDDDPDLGGGVGAPLAVVADVAQGTLEAVTEVELVPELLPGALAARLGVVQLGQLRAAVRAEGEPVERGGQHLRHHDRCLTDAKGQVNDQWSVTSSECDMGGPSGLIEDR